MTPAEPRCMTPAEIDAWWRANRTIRNQERTAVSPCQDCSRIFADTMRMVGRCDGRYPGEITAPEDEDRRSRAWAYPSEEERLEARRASWRASQARRRTLQGAV